MFRCERITSKAVEYLIPEIVASLPGLKKLSLYFPWYRLFFYLSFISFPKHINTIITDFIKISLTNFSLEKDLIAQAREILGFIPCLELGSLRTTF